MKNQMKCKDRHCWSTAPSGVGRSGWFLRFFEDWKYRRDGFSHRYRSENVVSLLCFAETAQAFLGEV
jgi:hypothetical protein